MAGTVAAQPRLGTLGEACNRRILELFNADIIVSGRGFQYPATFGSPTRLSSCLAVAALWLLALGDYCLSGMCTTISPGLDQNSCSRACFSMPKFPGINDSTSSWRD